MNRSAAVVALVPPGVVTVVIHGAASRRGSGSDLNSRVNVEEVAEVLPNLTALTAGDEPPP